MTKWYKAKAYNRNIYDEIQIGDIIVSLNESVNFIVIAKNDDKIYTDDHCYYHVIMRFCMNYRIFTFNINVGNLI